MSHKFTYRGREYGTISAACREYGLGYHSVLKRMRDGMSFTEAAEYPGGRGTPATDHMGNRYRTRSAMCRAYGLTLGLVDFRLYQMDWPLEKALTTPPRGKVITDHTGRQYSSTKEMCRAWGIAPHRFHARMSRWRDIGKALTTPVRLWQKGGRRK